MALDTGHAPLEVRADPDWKDVVPSITDASTLGDGLRIAREHTGRSLAELAAITRVPSRYLIALEQNDFSTLPNRVFSIGYVRSYAGALGLDEQLAVERFKRESPDPSVPPNRPSPFRPQERRKQVGSSPDFSNFQAPRSSGPGGPRKRRPKEPDEPSASW
jgi:hypothetical protein